ncbi:MAG: hypothetical protein HGA31_04415 [Candidatus Moranbacteria bacterium]|nr:hypothetical protein [Candidatus Moranbacteria bacterium]
MRRCRGSFIGLLLTAILAVAIPSVAETQPRIDDRSEVELKYGPGWGVFRAIVESEYFGSQIDLNRQIGDYISVTQIDLATDKETYLAEGQDLPFFGANRPMFWVVQRYPYGKYGVIATVGAAHQVTAGWTYKNGYRVLEIRQIDSWGKRWVTKMIYLPRFEKYADTE